MYVYTVIYTYIGDLYSLYPVYPGYTTCHQVSLYSMYAYTNIYAYIDPYSSLII